MDDLLSKVRMTLELRREVLLARGPALGTWAAALARELAEIDQALERVRLGVWDRCASCGGPIGRQRLLAVPESLRCMQCSTG